MLVDHRNTQFTNATEAACGAEGFEENAPIDVPLSTECATFNLKDAANNWNPKDFNVTKTIRNYCVGRTGAFGWRGWGPC